MVQGRASDPLPADQRGTVMKWATATLIFLSLVSCNDLDENPETIDSIRTLAAVPSPVAIEAPFDGEESWSFATFHVAVPTKLGGAIGRPFVDQKFRGGVRGKMGLVAGNLEEHGPVRIILLEGRAAVPSKKLMYQQLGNGDHVLRYGMNMFVIDGEKEQMLSEFWVTEHSSSPKLAWKNPTVTIDSPVPEDVEPVSPRCSRRRRLRRSPVRYCRLELSFPCLGGTGAQRPRTLRRFLDSA